MHFCKVSGTRAGLCTTAGLTCALLGVGAAIFAATPSRLIVIPIEEAKFDPPSPIGNTVAASALLWGDPAKGPFSGLIRLKNGSSNIHYHSADYQLVVIQGTMTHRVKGVVGSDSKSLRPGSYWFEPRGLVHQDSCLSDECLFFAYWMGKGDSIPASMEN